MHTLIIQFPQSDSFDADDDLEFRGEVESIAHDCLSSNGLGDCDGADIGSGTINVFCHVRDGATASASIAEALAAEGLEGFVIAIVEAGEEEDRDPVVVWPKDFTGTFRVL